jgi:AcrR family transcriptional regulator
MAIYHHVASKEELLDLMADESLKALPPIHPNAPWDRELQRWFTSLHELYLAHPALAQAMTQRPLEGPTAITVGDQVLALLTAAGLNDNQAVAAFIALTNYTIGASLYRLSRRKTEPASRRQRLADLTEQSAPTAYRLRRKIATSADSSKQFTDGLTRLIASYREEST